MGVSVPSPARPSLPPSLLASLPPSLPPLGFCVGCHLYRALGRQQPAPPAPGAGSTSANVTGVGKTKALPEGALAGRRQQQGVGVGVQAEGWAPKARPFSARSHRRPCHKHPWGKGGGENLRTAPVKERGRPCAGRKLTASDSPGEKNTKIYLPRTPPCTPPHACYHLLLLYLTKV